MRRRAYAVVVLAVLWAALAGVNVVYTAHQVSSEEHNWCDTITLLTAHPVPRPADPAANPSREQTYVLYEDFVTLERRFGC